MDDILSRWIRFRSYLSDDFGGGPRWLKLSWVINVQKGGTLPFVLLLMAITGDFGPTIWTYAALHGSYGLCWLLKDRLFPDPNWDRRITFGGAVMSWLWVLGPYWIAPILIVTRDVEAPPWLLAVATIAYVLGVVLMMGSDTQKYFVLKARKGLITDGYFSRIRHPNYLGEMVLYGSFALLALHWLPWLVLVTVWTLVFLPNIVMKEKSLSRYPGWAEYKARTGLLLPKIGPTSASSAALPGSPRSDP